VSSRTNGNGGFQGKKASDPATSIVLLPGVVSDKRGYSLVVGGRRVCGPFQLPENLLPCLEEWAKSALRECRDIECLSLVADAARRLKAEIEALKPVPSLDARVVPAHRNTFRFNQLKLLACIPERVVVVRQSYMVLEIPASNTGLAEALKRGHLDAEIVVGDPSSALAERITVREYLERLGFDTSQPLDVSVVWETRVCLYQTETGQLLLGPWGLKAGEPLYITDIPEEVRALLREFEPTHIHLRALKRVLGFDVEPDQFASTLEQWASYADRVPPRPVVEDLASSQLRRALEYIESVNVDERLKLVYKALAVGSPFAWLSSHTLVSTRSGTGKSLMAMLVGAEVVANATMVGLIGGRDPQTRQIVPGLLHKRHSPVQVEQLEAMRDAELADKLLQYMRQGEAERAIAGARIVCRGSAPIAFTANALKPEELSSLLATMFNPYAFAARLALIAYMPEIPPTHVEDVDYEAPRIIRFVRDTPYYYRGLKRVYEQHRQLIDRAEEIVVDEALAQRCDGIELPGLARICVAWTSHYSLRLAYMAFSATLFHQMDRVVLGDATVAWSDVEPALEVLLRIARESIEAMRKARPANPRRLKAELRLLLAIATLEGKTRLVESQLAREVYKLAYGGLQNLYRLERRIKRNLGEYRELLATYGVEVYVDGDKHVVIEARQEIDPRELITENQDTKLDWALNIVLKQLDSNSNMQYQ